MISEDGDALVEHGPAWTDALRAAGGWQDCSRLYEFDDGRTFVLPLVRRHTHRWAPQSGFSDGWGIGGIVGTGLDAEALALIDADLQRLDALWIQVRTNPVQRDLWHSLETSSTSAKFLARRAHVIELVPDSEQVFARFSQSGRRHVRKALKQGVTTKTFVGGERLDLYYDQLFLPSVARWAERQREPLWLAMARAKRRDPLSKLQRLAGSLGDAFRLTLALVDGQPAAGNIVLEGPNAHYTRGAMNDLASRNGAAYLALWVAIEHASLQGDKWFHMGETGSNERLSSYKESFGAVAYEYAEYRRERLPFVAVDQAVRGVVKRAIGFVD